MSYVYVTLEIVDAYVTLEILESLTSDLQEAQIAKAIVHISEMPADVCEWPDAALKVKSANDVIVVDKKTLLSTIKREYVVGVKTLHYLVKVTVFCYVQLQAPCMEHVKEQQYSFLSSLMVG